MRVNNSCMMIGVLSLFSAHFMEAKEIPVNIVIQEDYILTDRYGDSIFVENEDVLPALLQLSPKEQIPMPVAGRLLHPKVQERMTQAYLAQQENNSSCQWFPSHQPPMGAVIGGIDEFGNTANQPGALFKSAPVSNVNQSFKKWASTGGFDYSMHWAEVSGFVDNGVAGTPSDQHYLISVFEIHWNFLSCSEKKGTWLNFELDSSYGIGRNSKRQAGIQNAVGSAMAPNYGESSPNGSYVGELSLMQSFNQGDGVVVMGLVDATNYLDTNPYANTEFGLFMNSALNNSAVVPLTYANLGILSQFQLTPEWYLMLSVSTTSSTNRDNPFKHISTDDMAYVAELGWVDDDVMGLGAGGYRVQPFLATVNGETQPGVGFNFNQDLGKASPLALFGRAGVGGNQVTTVRGAQAQVAAGLVVKRPLNLLGLLNENSNNFIGIAGIWTKTPQKSIANNGRDETAMEINYTIQITPTMLLQPNYQLFFNPANNATHNTASVFQIQVSHLW